MPGSEKILTIPPPPASDQSLDLRIFPRQIIPFLSLIPLSSVSYQKEFQSAKATADE
jgi:hypothetical protein